MRRPLGPDELPGSLPGRWKVSLCVSTSPSHAWIRFEHAETGEVRSISRFHLLVGGWHDDGWQWHYPPTTQTGVFMDREQKLEVGVKTGKYLLLSKFIDNPKIYVGDDRHGHGMVSNNCASYARDAWQFYTGEYYPLPRLHVPGDLLRAVVRKHPEVLARRAER